MEKSELMEIIGRHREWLLSIGVYGKEASFRHVDLGNIDLTGVDLGSINLEGVLNLSAEQLCRARSLFKTKLPPDLERQVKTTCPDLFEKPED